MKDELDFYADKHLDDDDEDKSWLHDEDDDDWDWDDDEYDFEDERLTTVSATRMLLEADVSRGKRKKVVDKIAAVFILESYLGRMQG